jgi:PAS domain S-box-containing protein
MADFRQKFAMHEYLVYPLGSQALPLAILVIGNSLDNCRFYHRISECEGSLLGIGNLVGLLSSSIENRILYEDMNKALELVKLAEARYRNIFENAAEGIFQTTVEGRFISCNPATARILGYDSPEELITGTSDIGSQLYVHPQQRSELLEILQHRSKIKNYEVEFYRKDGKKQWTLLSVHASFDNQGEMTYLNGIMLDIAERKRVEELIRSSLREKELLLREIHHRVKNNLQIITTLLDLQSMSVSDSKSRRVFRECQDRIRSIALIHEKLYETTDFVSIVFADYLENLVMHLMEMYIPDDRISIEIEVSDIILGIDDAIPCGLIVNELVTNSFKYAFSYDRRGELKVIMGIDNDNLVTLHVADNGPGLPPGLDFRNTETLGLQLVNLLVKQLKGRLELKDGPGTAFDIIFQRRPVAKER